MWPDAQKHTDMHKHSKSKADKRNKENITQHAAPRGGAIQERGGSRSAAVAIEATVPYLDIPRDNEDWRFARSFAPVGEEADARAFLAEYGFCVFRDVLTATETAATRNEILSYIEQTTPGFDAKDEGTWETWRDAGNTFGMPPPDPAAWWQPQLARNRRHPRVIASFAQLLATEAKALRCSHDRWALYTRGARTRRNVHLDINPFMYLNGADAIAAARRAYAYAGADELFGGHDNLVSAAHGPHLQGTIAHLDNLEEDAGFLCVPGSHSLFERWADTLRPETGASGPRYDFPDHSHFHTKAQRVPVREGSLIVWDVRLVHGSAPDQSPQGVETRPRFVQFVSLRTKDLCDEGEPTRRKAGLVQRLFKEHGLTEPKDAVERAVAGLPAWIK